MLINQAFHTRPPTSTSLAYATEAVRLLDDVTTATPGIDVLYQRIGALRTEAEVLAQLGQTTAGLSALKRTQPYIAEAITRAPTDLRFHAALHYANGREKEARAIIEDLIAKGLFYHSWEEFVSSYQITQPQTTTQP